MSLISANRRRPRVALFFSGAGSTLQALLDQSESLNIICTISSKKKALGRLRSNRQGVMNYVFKFPEDFSLALEILKAKAIDTVMLVGFMKIVPVDFVERFKKMGPRQRIVNIHPSLLPNFKGLQAVEKAYEEKASMGVTIHEVVAEVDSGEFYKRLQILNSKQVVKIDLKEAFLWQRVCEQHILRSWGSLVA